MRTMTKERKKEGPRLGHKGRADAKASRQLLLLCIPAIIAYILFNYIPMGAAVIIPFKNYKFSKGILGSDWCGLANFKWIIQSVALDRALRNTVLYGLLFMVLSPVTNVIIALLLFEITSRRRLKTYQTIITFPNFMSMVIVGYIVYAILSPRTGLMNQIIQFFGGDPVDVYMNSKYWPFILTVVNIWKGIGMGSMMYFAALMGIDTSLYEAAEIDGASRFQKMLHISLPHLVPLICIFTIMNAGTLISGNFDLFYVIPRNTSTLYATTDNAALAQSIQSDLKQVGIDVKIEQVDTAALLQKLNTGEMDMYQTDMGNSTMTPQSLLNTFSEMGKQIGENMFTTPEYNALVSEIKAMSDNSQLEAKTQEGLEMLRDMYTFVNLYQADANFAYSSDFVYDYPVSATTFIYYYAQIKPAA